MPQLSDNTVPAVHADLIIQAFRKRGEAAARKIALLILSDRPTEHIHEVGRHLPPEILRVLPKRRPLVVDPT